MRRKIANGLSPAVFFEFEIALGESLDELSLFVADRDQDVNNVDGGREIGLLSPDDAANKAKRGAPG